MHGWGPLGPYIHRAVRTPILPPYFKLGEGKGAYGPPTYGAEPCGYDYIYQDIEVPATSPTLEFDFNLQTFDAEPWDWFDMFIKNPNTNSNLATVVSHWGKPGSQYGTYWNGDWQHVSYDLSSWSGQTVRLWFGNRQDGWGDQNVLFLDNVSVGCGGGGGGGAGKVIAQNTHFIRDYVEIDKEVVWRSHNNENEADNLPNEFVLMGNSPNPFNPVTTIKYGLPEDSYVKLAIYNISGQRIATLVNEEQQASYHQVSRDGKGMASGIYFYRIQAGDFVETRKMIMLK